MRCSAAFIAVAALFAESVAATAWLGSRSVKPTPTKKRDNSAPADPGFVTVNNGQFMKNGKPFFYFGTNAYWLQHLSDENLNLTLSEIAARNFTVVRTWAFNDVTEVPSSGAWFQLFNPNGTVTINNGTNGLQRLDKVVDMAEEKGLMVQFALTNNWNPHPNDTSSTSSSLTRRQNDNSTNTTVARGTLSNDYGGMDAYVRAHQLTNHDAFYSNETLITAFENYLSVLIPRYSNRTNVLAWEIANDARCSSTLDASPDCKTQTVTMWHSRISDTVKKLDPNHTVASGTQGFMCVPSAQNPCTKLFFKTPPPPPAASPAPGKRKVTLTEKGILSERRARFKRTLDDLTRRYESAADKRKRGGKARWSYRGTSIQGTGIIRRQSTTQAMGPASDGSQGVDSLDIGAIPNIGFSTFQLFPDQNVYEPPNPNLPALNNTIQSGVNWITQQATAAQILNKPIALTGFGLVSQQNLPNFVPFNASQPLFPGLTSTTTTSATPTPTPGVGIEQGQAAFSDQQQAAIYQEWIQAAINQDVQGIVQYQWGQGDLAPTNQNIVSGPDNEQGFTPLIPALTSTNQNTSPNDGYQAISPLIQNVLQLGAIRQNLKNIDVAAAFP